MNILTWGEEKLRSLVRDQQARLDDRARRLQELKDALKQLKTVQRENEQLKHVVRTLSRRHYSNFPSPPEPLRLNVGTNTTEANFWSQGMASSSRVLEVFGDSPRGPILDWGCGSGRTLHWLLAYPAWREHYHGTDVDAAAIEWLKGQGHGKVTVCQDAPPLPYEPETFAGVFAFSVLTHIHPENHRQWYEELHRVLRKDGTAYLTTLGVSGAEGQGEEAAAEVKQRGFTYLRREGHYKNAAIAGEEYTRKQLEGLFAVEAYKARGYNNMDAFLVRRLG